MMSTYQELKAQAEVLLKQAEETRIAEVKTAINTIKQVMKEYDLTLDDLKDKPKKNKSISDFKYENTETGDRWTGHGRTPKWMMEKLLQGHKKEDFLIE